MTKKVLLATALFFCTLNYAQDKKTEPAKDTQSRIKVYTPSSSVSKSSSSSNAYKWIIKTDLFGFAAGEFPIIGEYRIANKFSVEASAGLTYAYLPNDFLSSSTNSSDNSDNTKAAMGSAFRGAIKFYPSSDYDAIEGWNFGLEVFSKTMNREYTNSNSYDGLLNGQKDTKVKTGFALIIGKQIFQDSNVAFESFIGIGFANVKRTYSDVLYNNTTSLYELKSITTNETKPSLQLGFRIGFGN